MTEPGAQAIAGAFHTITLGCKLNQFDGAAIEAELMRRGLSPVGDPALASVVVINTCTVTARADAEARKLVRRVRRANPRCRLLLTGCYAERDPNGVAVIDGVDAVFGNRDKARLDLVLDRLDVGAADRADVRTGHRGDRGCDGSLSLPTALHFGDRSRAFLKIQQGCNLVCSYCVIPQVRGASRSVPPRRIVESFCGLIEAGYREIVLTGVNTGDYGRDLRPRLSLVELLDRLLARRGPARIRLNSLEPRTVTDEVIALIAERRGLVPHLQVPLQSGSDRVLRGMRRNYRTSFYLERLERLREAVPEIGLGADVIVGFPGETGDDFARTYDLVESSPLNYLHVFPWSARPGTPAATLEGRVDAAEQRGRSAALRSLGRTLGRAFRDRFVGQRLEGVVLESGTRRARALTGNFIDVELEADALPPPRSLVDLCIRRVDAEVTRGSLWPAAAVGH